MRGPFDHSERLTRSYRGPAKEATVKDIRCLVGVHAWKKRHVEGSAYLECRRCGKQTDAPTRGPMGTAGGLGAG